MAIESYADLAEVLKSYCVRSDTKFSNRIETFVGFAEDRIYNGCGDDESDPVYSPPVRTDEMKAEATVAITSGSGTLPTDTIGVRLIKRASDKLGLDYISPERWAIREAQSSGGDPQFYTVEGNTLKVTPTYDGDLTLLYWKRLPALTSADNTNALLSAQPRLYLAGTLFEAFTWMQESDLALGHLGRFRSIAAGVNKTERANRYGGGRLKVRPRVPMP